MLANILRDYGMQYPLIQKSVGTNFTKKLKDEDIIQSTIRYYIENKVYKLDKEYKISEPLSPLIPKKNAHLVIGFDPIPVLANLDFISEKSFIILNANLKGKKNNKSVGEIVDLLDQLARITISMDFNKLANEVFGNLNAVIFILLGLITREFKELIRKKYLLNLLSSFENDFKQPIEAFDLGYSLV
jgi:Pyruvate/2-oxoacid:ferredoxin oxidoreductase gamma subunit